MLRSSFADERVAAQHSQTRCHDFEEKTKMSSRKRPSQSDNQRQSSGNKCLINYTDGTIIVEMVRTPDGRLMFTGRKRDGNIVDPSTSVRIAGEDFFPLASDLVRNGDVAIPPPAHELAQDPIELFNAIKDFFARHVTWTDEFLVGATAYVLAAWVYGRFQFLGYLQFIGPPGSGKSRSLEVLAGLCYHAFKVGSITSAALYRVISRYHATLLIDEIDVALLPTFRAILREGSSRNGRVVRCQGEDHEETSFSCFGPKVYGGQEPIVDAAFATRVIQENMARVKKASHIGTQLPESFDIEARELTSRLLRWKLDNYWSLQIYDLNIKDARQAQVFIPLFSVTPRKYHGVLRRLMERQRETSRREMQESLEGEVLAAIHELGSPPQVRPIDVAKVVCKMRDVDYERQGPERVTAKKVSIVFKRLGFDVRHRFGNGVFYRLDPTLVAELLDQYLPEGERVPGEQLVGSGGQKQTSESPERGDVSEEADFHDGFDDVPEMPDEIPSEDPVEARLY
jgi:energy-coupling factor transporter ATP-binding protein EcfA2